MKNQWKLTNINKSIPVYKILKAINNDLEELGDLELTNKTTITGITSDSRKVSKGDLFIAYRGFKEDGHNYINEAINKGASAVLTEKPVENLNIPHLKVRDGRKALAKASAAFYGYPSNKMVMTGITGTNGKTSTSFLINYLIKCDNKNSGLLGTIHNKINDEPVDSILTTPTAPDLHKTLYNMYQSNVKFVTMEVSSHSLKEKRINEIDFDIAGITNFSFDHPEYHPDDMDYFFSKAKLFKLLKPSGFAIFNADDPHALEFCNRTKAQIITYSLEYKHSMIKISNLRLKKNHSIFELKINEELPTIYNKIIPPGKKEITVPLPGKHHVYNSALAITIALLLEIDLENIAYYLTSFPGIFRRFQLVYQGKFTIIDDFAHNPDSIKTSINTAKMMKFNSIIPLVAIRGGRGEKINEQNAKSLCSHLKDINLKEFILTKYTDTSKEENQVKKNEADIFINKLKAENFSPLIYNDLEHALKKALKLAEKDDLILLLGGHGLDNAQEIIQNLIKNGY